MRTVVRRFAVVVVALALCLATSVRAQVLNQVPAGPFGSTRWRPEMRLASAVVRAGGAAENSSLGARGALPLLRNARRTMSVCPAPRRMSITSTEKGWTAVPLAR